MLSLRMAGICLFAGLVFMYGLSLWLPAVLFHTIGAMWSVAALWQIQLEEDE